MSLDVHTNALWRGQLIGLRAIEPEDWEVFAEQETDVVSTRHGTGWAPVPWSRHRLKEWAQDLDRSQMKDDSFRWVIEAGGGAVAGSINTHRCDRRTGAFSYGVLTFPDHRRRGYASEAIRLVLAYYFGELRYQECTVTIYSFNDASLALHRRLGFSEEGRIRRTVYTAGALHDEFVMGITAEEFVTM